MTSVGSILRQVYFLNLDTTTKQSGSKKFRLVYQTLRCHICDRIFHRRFGLKTHLIQDHDGAEPPKEAKQKANKANKRPLTWLKRFKNDVRDSDEYSDGFDSSEQEFEELLANHKPKDKIVPKKKKRQCQNSINNQITSLDLPTAVSISELPDFQPTVGLRDIYKFDETIFQLPCKEETVSYYNNKLIQQVLEEEVLTISESSESESSFPHLDSNGSFRDVEPVTKSEFMERVRRKSGEKVNKTSEINQQKSEENKNTSADTKDCFRKRNSVQVVKNNKKHKKVIDSDDDDVIILD